MTFIPAAYAECSLEFSIPGDAGPAFTTFGVKDELFGPGPDGTLATVGDAVNNDPGIRGLYGNGATLTTLTIRYGLGGGDIAIRESFPNIQGQSAAPFAPPQVAILLQKSSGLAGRSNRGRMYIPCVSEAQIQDDGILAPAALTGLQTSASAFFNDLATLDVPMVILHDDPAQTPTLVTSLTVAAKVATQRRRLR